MANKIPEIKISTVASTTTYIEDTIDPPIYEQEESSNYLHLDDRRRGKEYKDLDDLLRDVAIEHEDKDRIDSFWPSKLLATVLTRDRILEELIGLGDALVKQTLSDLADEIFTRHRKIFAILSLLGKGTCIVELMDDNLKDTDLPLVPCDAEKGYRHILARRTLPMVPLQCLQDWPPQLRKSFKEMQHRLSPAFLDLTTDPASGQRVVQHKEFESAVVLPFMECEQKEHGGYGIVSRVKIHSHCHGFCDILRPIETDQYFALKRIIKTPKARQTNSDIDFWNEVDSLKRFSGFSHEHLVTLLMTWTIRDRYYLLFPLAECDLDRYWESKTIPEDPYNQLLDIETLEWLLEQVHGMTDALDKIHNPSWNTLSPQDQFGRHGDLKPENVLWYRSTAHAKGIFVIADLGLAKLNSVLSRSAAPNSEVHATPRYRPPEYDLKGAKISRSYDIWTFGCLLLELVCWALGKSEAREQFAKARMSPYVTGSCSDIFFDVKRKTKDADNTERGGFVLLVKEQVTKQIARLHNDPRCSLFFHDLLYLIEEDMIIVLSATKSRISSSALLQKLADMRTRAENEGSEYLQRPCPQPRLPNCYDPVDAVLTFLTEDQVDRLHVHTGLSQRPENVI